MCQFPELRRGIRLLLLVQEPHLLCNRDIGGIVTARPGLTASFIR